jgi:hypothetical protein
MGRPLADRLSRFTGAGIGCCGIIRWGKIDRLTKVKGGRDTTTASAVASFLVLVSLEGSIVLCTTSIHGLPSMFSPAAERTE